VETRGEATVPEVEPDFFISYTGKDEPWAEWIAWQLKEAGYTTLLQAWDFGPGSDFVQKMQEAVTSAKRTLAVLSPAYFESKFGEAEWHAVFAADPLGEQGLLVPVRVRDVKPPGLLKTRVYIDLVGLDEAGAKQRLLALLRGEGIKPSRAPQFPGAGPGSIAEQPEYLGDRDLPKVWKIPYPRHPSFVGRAELLAALEGGFTGSWAGAGGPRRRQVLVGLVGVGKTQLAVEYAYRHRADYDLVWWVRASAPETLVGDYAELARRVGLEDYSDQDATIEAVRTWLEGRGRWLLVLDGADGDPGPLKLKDLLPWGGQGHVLVTSRRGVGWDGVATPVAVDVLSGEEAARFLVDRTGEQDPAAAGELAEALGRLPLALEQAGAAIAQAGIVTIAGYLEQFQRRAEPLAEGPAGTAWDISLAQIRKESPAAVELLELAAFLAPDDLPWRQLVEHPDLLPDTLAGVARDPLRLGEAVVALRRYSLAKVVDQSVSVNRLLQAVVERRLDPATRRARAAAAVRLLDASFPKVPEQRSDWQACQQLLPHALRVVEHAERLGVERDRNAELLSRAVDYLRVRGQPLQAHEVVERALRAGEAGEHPQAPATAVIRRSFGRVLHDLGRLEEARAQLELALGIDKGAFGEKHERVAEDRRYLGQVLREQGYLDEARKEQLQWALVIDEEVHGLRDHRVAEDRRHLALVLHNLGNLAGARAQLTRALAIDEAIFGAKDQRTADDHRQLGLVLRDLGDFAAARTEVDTALAIDVDTFGPDHWRVAQDRRYLATVLRDAGELERAREELERALAIDKTVYVPEDWRSAQDRRYLGTVLCLQRRFGRAREQLERALAIDVDTFGPDHWRVAQDRRHLGRALHGLGQLAAARAELERALQIDESRYGPGDWRVAEDRHYLSLVLRDVGELPKARDELERALAIDESTFGPDHWRVALDWGDLTTVLRDLGPRGELAKAKVELEQALATFERIDPAHPVATTIRGDLDKVKRELDERG